VRGGRLPQHQRVLGEPRGDLPHRWRPVHPALRPLPDRHRQARRARPRRAPAGGRVGAHDGPAVLDGHRRRPRRPARRRCVALRRDGAADPPAEPGTGVELLIPDFNSHEDQLGEVFGARPEVLAHNLETMPRIFKRIRRRSATTAPWRC
jgi:hypothetical protein